MRYNKIMPLPEVKYAIYPGTVSVRDEDGNAIGDATFTALELATAYGVQDEDYLTIDDGDPEPQGMAYFEYIHLKPRADNKYQNMKSQIEDIYRPDFDGTKRWTDETQPDKIDPELDEEPYSSRRIGYFR